MRVPRPGALHASLVKPTIGPRPPAMAIPPVDERSERTIVDQPHFQLRPAWAADMSEREMLASLRRRLTDGTPVYA
jgi:hypothetical protein